MEVQGYMNFQKEKNGKPNIGYECLALDVRNDPEWTPYHCTSFSRPYICEKTIA